MLILETPRIIIREFLPEEQETYLNHFTDERVALYLPKRSREERIVIFQTALQRYEETKAIGTWGMFDKMTTDFIGSCLLREFDGPEILEIGYSMEQKYWGRGLGIEMAAAMLDYGFTNNKISSIAGVTVLDNTASQKVLEKAGMKKQANIIRNGEELALFWINRMFKI